MQKHIVSFAVPKLTDRRDPARSWWTRRWHRSVASVAHLRRNPISATLQPVSRRDARAFAILATVAIVFGVNSGSAAIAAPGRAEAPRHELLDAAKEPFQRGLLATQQQDWKLAIRYLAEAQKADPDAPEILFNLGLASSKLPGYELRSMAWFQAFLLADRNAPNAKAVRSQLMATEVAFESKLDRILEQLESIAAIVRPNVFWARDAASTRTGFSIPAELAAAHNFLGDSAGALRLLAANDLSEADVQGKTIAASDPYTYSVASTGRFADANFSGELRAMSFVYEKGDLAAVQTTISKLNWQPEFVWTELGCAAYEAGNQEILKSVTDKILSHPPEDYWDLGSTERYLIAVGRGGDAQKMALANKSNSRNASDGELTGKTAVSLCSNNAWWGRNRAKWLVDFALSGLILDPKKQLDETELDEFLRQTGTVMTSPNSGDPEKQQEVAQALELQAAEVRDVAKAYRIIRGPKE